MPAVAAALTGMLYVGMQHSITAQPFTAHRLTFTFSIAAGITLLVWLGLALLCVTNIRIEAVNPRSFGLLKSEIALYESYCNHGLRTDRAGNEASGSLTYLQEFMKTASGFSWMLETGYITSWEALNRVKEALMELHPDAVVIGEAFSDWLSIKGSNMPNSELLLKDSAQAIRILAPAANAFFEENAHAVNHVPCPPAGAFPGSATTDHAMPAVAPGGSAPSMPAGNPASPATTGNPAPSSVTDPPLLAMAGNPSPEQQARDQAKSILRQIRTTLNRYVSNNWEALIHTRNLLLATTAITGVVLYLLVALAAVTHAPPSALVAGMVFYTIGAISGLFGWLYRGSHIDATVDDYGLMPARLIATPLLSGLGGIGGVIITAILYSIVLRADGGPTNPQNFAASLGHIFTLYPPLLLAAALFGLFPSLIIGTLLKQSHLYIEDLKAVRPSEQGTY